MDILKLIKILLVSLVIIAYSFTTSDFVRAEESSSEETSNSEDEDISEEDSEQSEEEETVDPEIISELFEQSFLQDRNGDGLVIIDGFGDSLSRGTGDFIGINEIIYDVSQPTGEAGYPLRIELLLGINVSNLGNPGERLVDDGLYRFARTIPGSTSDIVIILEGSNDGFSFTSAHSYFRSVQTMINIARANNKLPVLTTIPSKCCERSSLNPFIDSYNSQLRTLAAINDIPIADAHHAFYNICSGRSTCYLLNRPEGNHPNIEGYDVIGENIIATLLKIDLFLPDGKELLEAALNLSEGSVITKPDEVMAITP